MKTICNLIMCCLTFLSAFYLSLAGETKEVRGDRQTSGAPPVPFSCWGCCVTLQLYHVPAPAHVHAHVHVHAHSHPGAHRPPLHNDCDKLAGTVWGKGGLLDWTKSNVKTGCKGCLNYNPPPPYLCGSHSIFNKSTISDGGSTAT